MMVEDGLCVLDAICNHRHRSIILGDIAPVLHGDWRWLRARPFITLYDVETQVQWAAGSRNVHCKNQETDTSTGIASQLYSSTGYGMYVYYCSTE